MLHPAQVSYISNKRLFSVGIKSVLTSKHLLWYPLPKGAMKCSLEKTI